MVIDEDGQIDIQTDNEQLFDQFFQQKSLEKSKKFFRRTLKTVIEKIWKEKNTCFSKVIRLLSMVEICASAEPYMQAEDLWYTLMFKTIPETENLADTLKKPYGYNPNKKTRPITGTGFDLEKMMEGGKWLS